ncbi:uncharacterized protein A4U43_C02F14630 [Asparagus officinalis]|uniref:Uncharacterized protein n=1 Tax=Asparagus officinalis TaxID=4686 RepID=A0A5P1FL28_ASPOF|nr:uncharacterized protein A4U43_C02F14630 [Asparagus officinalis]
MLSLEEGVIPKELVSQELRRHWRSWRCCDCLFKDPVNRRNNYSHNGTNDPKMAYPFDSNVLLFFEGSSQERVAIIRSGDYWTLREIVTDAKFSVPNEDALMKPHFLFRDCQVSFIFLQCLVVPRFMHYNLTNREDSVKVGSLKHDDGFHQDGLYGVSIMGLRPGFMNEDIPVNEVVVAPNIFGNKLAKTEAQYPDGDTRCPAGWIQWTDTLWWTHLVDFALVTFVDRLQGIELNATPKDRISFKALLSAFLLAFGYNLALLPVMVSYMHHRLRELATKYLKWGGSLSEE